MIHKESWSQLAGLMLTAQQLVDGLYAGAHASRHRGPGLEFHDYRPYVPGDDLAAVDWKLFGRTDRYHLKRYQRHTDLHLYLLIDASASMRFAGLDRRGRAIESDDCVSKFDYARQIAAALAFLAIRQADRVGVGIFADQLNHHEPVAGSWAHLQRVIRTMEKAHPRRSEGNIRKAIAQAHALLPRRGLVVILSDFLDEPADLFDGLNRLRHARFDVAAIQILTAQERSLATIAPARLQMVDLETRDTVTTDLRTVASRYQQVFGEHLNTVRQGCVGRGIDHELTTTDRPVIETLRRYLTRR